MKQYGKIHPPKTLFFRQAVGTVTDNESNEYDCTLNMGGVHPIVCSKKTGKWFTLGWDDIVRLAVKAGIDKEA